MSRAALLVARSAGAVALLLAASTAAHAQPGQPGASDPAAAPPAVDPAPAAAPPAAAPPALGSSAPSAQADRAPPSAGAASPGDEPPPAEPGAEQAQPSPPPIDDDDKRPVPDYDGRGDEPTEASDVLIWVPRVLFAPVYAVSEYVIRWPLGTLVTAAEKADLPALMVDFFTFGPENKAGLVPTALIDFGLRTSVGFYFFWDDYLADGQDLRVRAATGGSHWFLANVTHRAWLDEAQEDTSVDARFEFSLRPDYVYHGVGPSSRDSAESYYEARHFEGGAKFRSRFWRTSTVEAYLAARDMAFFDEGCCPPEDVRLGERVAQGAFNLPPGWEDGYTVFLQSAQVALDTRELRDTQVGEGSDFVSPPGSGLRLALRGLLAEGIRATPRPTATSSEHLEWVQYGATLGGFLDLTGQQRVLGLTAIVDFADPLVDGGEIPFTELVSLGGDRPMRGFLPGRLRGQSSVVWQLEYQWPIWVWLDGAMRYSVGNVFGEHLEDFDAKLLRQSFGLGVRAAGARDHPFEVLLAFGSEPFEEGGSVDSVRFVLGTTSGF